MSTRSFIALKTQDVFKGVYCHWDGNLERNGVILYKHYNDSQKVEKLLSFGDISSLTSKTGEINDVQDSKLCRFYHRDSKESWEDTKPMIFNNIDNLKCYARTKDYDFLYLFNGKEWLYTNRSINRSTQFDFRPLAPEIINILEEDNYAKFL